MNHDTRTSNLRQLHCKTKQVSWLRLKSQREVGTKLLETSAPRSQRWQGNQMTHITSSKERISSQIEVQCSALCKSLNIAIYIYLNLHSYLSEFHFFERRIPYSKKSSFNPKVKYFISDSNIQLLLEWNWNSEAEHFISNQSNLAISEWVFCFLYLNLQKMRQLSKIFYYWQSFIFFFFLEIGFIRTPHSYQGLFAGSWEKLIPIASLYVWNLWVIWMQQKIIWELSLNRHRGSSVSLNTANLHLMGCVTATQPFPIETFFA